MNSVNPLGHFPFPAIRLAPDGPVQGTGVPATPTVTPAAGAPVRRILVVDDDPAVMTLAVRVLSLHPKINAERVEILQATHLKAALAVYDENAGSLIGVLTDGRYPHQAGEKTLSPSGLELYDHIRAKESSEGRPPVSIAIMSGGMIETAAEKRVQNIIARDTQTRFMEKPFFPQTLREWIDGILAL